MCVISILTCVFFIVTYQRYFFVFQVSNMRFSTGFLHFDGMHFRMAFVSMFTCRIYIKTNIVQTVQCTHVLVFSGLHVTFISCIIFSVVKHHRTSNTLNGCSPFASAFINLYGCDSWVQPQNIHYEGCM